MGLRGRNPIRRVVHQFVVYSIETICKFCLDRWTQFGEYCFWPGFIGPNDKLTHPHAPGLSPRLPPQHSPRKITTYFATGEELINSKYFRYFYAAIRSAQPRLEEIKIFTSCHESYHLFTSNVFLTLPFMRYATFL